MKRLMWEAKEKGTTITDVGYHKNIDKDGRGMRGKRRMEMVNVM